MKNIRVLLLVFISFLLIPVCVNAETIADYRAKIKAIEAEKAESNSKSAEVQKRIDDANARINEITRQIVQARKDQQSTQKEIDSLNDKIKNKKEEIKDLVAFYQISDNDNFYLKFIFGADSFEDFIYRFSVAEQLTDANDKLTNDLNSNYDALDNSTKGFKDDFSKNIDAIKPSTADFSKLSASANWVKSTFDNIVMSNSNLNLLLMISLTVGIALLLIGKVR